MIAWKSIELMFILLFYMMMMMKKRKPCSPYNMLPTKCHYNLSELSGFDKNGLICGYHSICLETAQPARQSANTLFSI